jgi:hypothetical protein
MDIPDACATGGAQRRVKLVVRQLLPLHHFGEELAVVDAKLRPPFHQHQHARQNSSSRRRVITTIHRVLHRVAEDGELDKVEGEQLADLTLAGESQHNQQEIASDEARKTSSRHKIVS